MNASGNPVILRYDRQGSHMVSGPVNKEINLDVDMLSFIVDRLNWNLF